jgi:hypothetical protein
MTVILYLFRSVSWLIGLKIIVRYEKAKYRAVI